MGSPLRGGGEVVKQTIRGLPTDRPSEPRGLSQSGRPAGDPSKAGELLCNVQYRLRSAVRVRCAGPMLLSCTGTKFHKYQHPKDAVILRLCIFGGSLHFRGTFWGFTSQGNLDAPLHS